MISPPLKLTIRATGQRRKQRISHQGISEEKSKEKESDHFSKRQITPTPIPPPQLKVSIRATGQRRKQQENPPETIFFGLRRHQRQGDFFPGFQTSPDQEGLTFFGCKRHQEMIARGSRRHLRSPFPG